MGNAVARGRLDPLLEWVGAVVPALCGGMAASMVGPLYGYTPLAAGLAAGGALFLGAFAFMRMMTPRSAEFPMAPVALPAAEEELLLDTRWQDVAAELDELWLDVPYREASMVEIGELVLDDALPAVADSRVVQLFEPQQLKERIDRHLANARSLGEAAPAPSAEDALSLALAELKRSLRRA